MWKAVLAISVGASAGALLRWGLGSVFNAALPTMPPGTVIANLLGGYLVGVAVAWLALHPEVPPEWRLFIITGFLGGLTTFSTFSAEVTHLLQAERWAWAFATVSVHVLGSLLMTFAGMATVAALRRA